ncbi:hypothetical protein T484DRAFT_1881874 [Baffinella frigidus]|nr:hypothetical protein T484DRAFT_1881874 [Cryptophyta sp. CCMP2293]
MPCTAGTNGGCLRTASGALDAYDCTFRGCAAQGSGGAASVTDSASCSSSSSSSSSSSASTASSSSSSRVAQLTVTFARCMFSGNNASGLGGGAIHIGGGGTRLLALVSADNAAPNGGGGLLLWEGDSPPEEIAWGGDAQLGRGRESNTAAYGPQFATPYTFLGVVPAAPLVSPGVEFSVVVEKRDFYGQLIVNDDASLLKLSARGRATFRIVVEPTFVPDAHTPPRMLLQGGVILSIQGLDSTSGRSMLSRLIPVAFQGGGDSRSMCPAGSVLEFDAGGGSDGTKGRCRACKAGKYASSPLKCVECPGGLECQGGTLIFPKEGFFAAQEDISSVLERFADWEERDEVYAYFREAPVGGVRRADVLSEGDKSEVTKHGTVESIDANGYLVMSMSDGTGRHTIPPEWVDRKVLRVWPCPPGACLGGGNFTCAQGHQGEACGRCNATVSENGTFFATNGVTCVVCSEDREGTVAALVCLAIGVVVFLALPCG